MSNKDNSFAKEISRFKSHYQRGDWASLFAARKLCDECQVSYPSWMREALSWKIIDVNNGPLDFGDFCLGFEIETPEEKGECIYIEADFESEFYRSPKFESIRLGQSIKKDKPDPKSYQSLISRREECFKYAEIVGDGQAVEFGSSSVSLTVHQILRISKQPRLQLNSSDAINERLEDSLRQLRRGYEAGIWPSLFDAMDLCQRKSAPFPAWLVWGLDIALQDYFRLMRNGSSNFKSVGVGGNPFKFFDGAFKDSLRKDAMVIVKQALEDGHISVDENGYVSVDVDMNPLLRPLWGSKIGKSTAESTRIEQLATILVPLGKRAGVKETSAGARRVKGWETMSANLSDETLKKLDLPENHYRQIKTSPEDK